MIPGLIFIALALVARAISELALHGKLKWSDSDNPIGFWGKDSYLRKYKYPGNIALLDYGRGWYYRFFKVKYKERFPLSATLLVFTTDGYHFMQWLSHLCIAFALISFLGIHFGWIWLWIYIGVILCHSVPYNVFGK